MCKHVLNAYTDTYFKGGGIGQTSFKTNITGMLLIKTNF